MDTVVETDESLNINYYIFNINNNNNIYIYIYNNNNNNNNINNINIYYISDLQSLYGMYANVTKKEYVVI